MGALHRDSAFKEAIDNINKMQEELTKAKEMIFKIENPELPEYKRPFFGTDKTNMRSGDTK